MRAALPARAVLSLAVFSPAVFALAFALVGCANAPPYAACGAVPCAMGGCYEVSLTRTDGTESRGSFCSSACETDADCADGGACIAVEHDRTGQFFCVARCETSPDCYQGLACTSLTAAGGAALSACLP